MRYFLFALLIQASLFCRSQMAGGLGEQYARLKETREIFDRYLRNTDSADWKINQLVALARKDEQVEFGSAMIKLQAALMLEKYVARPDSATFYLNFYLGGIFSGLSPANAVYFYRKCIAIGNACPQITHEGKFPLMGAMAQLFSKLHQDDSVLAYYRLAATEAINAPKSNVARASAENNIGIYWARTGRHDSAMACYNNALALLGGIKSDAVLYCSIHDNIAQEKERQNDIAAAVQTYRFNDSIYLTHNRPNRYVINKVRLLTALEKTHFSPVGIQKQIDTCAEYASTHRGNINPPEILNLYGFATRYFFNTNNKTAAAAYGRLYIALRDSIEKQNTSKLNILATSLLNVQSANFKSELEVRQLLVDRQKTAIVVSIILVLTGVVIIYLLMMYVRKRRQEFKTAQLFADEQLKTKELEAKAALHDLELKKKDLMNVVLYNTHVYENNRKLIEQLDEITHHGPGVEKSLRALLIDLKNHSQMGGSPITIQNNINDVNAGFFGKLKEAFPGLTPSETELCGYIRINLSNKDISLLKNVEPDSIKMGKNRLKKKLGLSAEDSLYDFINTF